MNEELSIRSYAHIGDAVYEVFAREKTVFLTTNPKKLHKLTVSIVNAAFQADILENVEVILNDEEKEIIRRARNLPVTTARRVNQSLHRKSTAFEALVGYLYLNNKERLEEVYSFISSQIDEMLKNSYLKITLN
jgi:ribonuclease-3 family protein